MVFLIPAAFYLRPSSDGIKHHATILLSHHGSEAVPEYFLRHPDPGLPASKNRYAVALYDIFNPEILFGEILIIPEWTQPTLSQEEIRSNGGVPPAPQPLLPTAFTIQLYNPDQQVTVRSYPGTWNSAPYWEFDMPQRSFRQPSNSTLDRTQSDPTVVETTPKSIFKWKKDGKLSKDYVCTLAGKSTDLHSARRKHKEPDITIALFRHVREITIYEPNLSRVEMEDYKGLEVVLLLGAVALREVFHRQLKDVFNIVDRPHTDSNGRDSIRPNDNLQGSSAKDSAPYIAVDVQQSSSILSHKPSPRVQPTPPRLPPTDLRSQWEIDQETARLKKQLAHEERERKRAEHAEIKRIKKMIEAEEREARAKQAEIDQETERLKRLYAVEEPSRQDRSQHRSASFTQTPLSTAPIAAARSAAQNHPARISSSSYLQAPHHATENGAKRLKGKRSLFGLRSFSDEQPRQLAKKQSAVW